MKDPGDKRAILSFGEKPCDCAMGTKWMNVVHYKIHTHKYFLEFFTSSALSAHYKLPG